MHSQYNVCIVLHLSRQWCDSPCLASLEPMMSLTSSVHPSVTHCDKFHIFTEHIEVKPRLSSNPTTTMKYSLLALAACFVTSSEAFTFTGPSVSPPLVTTATGTVMMAKRGGRGGLGDVDSERPKKAAKTSTAGMAPPGSNKSTWIPVQGMTTSMADLLDGSVTLVDTGAAALIKTATNPNGAVAVIKYGPSVFCTSVGCASCQIPLSKAEVLGPTEETMNDPRICCSFCRATYNLRTGERVATQEGGGLMGGLAKNIFSKQKVGSLPIYALGEKNGKVLINLG